MANTFYYYGKIALKLVNFRLIIYILECSECICVKGTSVTITQSPNDKYLAMAVSGSKQQFVYKIGYCLVHFACTMP